MLTAPITITSGTRLVDLLPGMPIKQVTADVIEHEIACIKREREIRRDIGFREDELQLLNAYLAQVSDVMQRSRDKSTFERTHPGIAYPWSVP